MAWLFLARWVMLGAMAQPASPLSPLLARLVAPLEPEERAALRAAIKQPEELLTQLSLVLDPEPEGPTLADIEAMLAPMSDPDFDEIERMMREQYLREGRDPDVMLKRMAEGLERLSEGKVTAPADADVARWVLDLK
ncbi:MAG: hypothetical protein EOO70_05790 [Myxococcaceae bacterium]|nr:MAG: hypothetical protein EOO70_05790 [Myxococcaceae bacterium]